MSESDSNSGTKTIQREKVKVSEPPLYKVLLLNDDYTSMDFVVAILEGVFQKPPAEATRIMLQVHNNGSGLCGIYPKGIAEAKVFAVDQRARQEGFPLKCIMEQE